MTTAALTLLVGLLVIIVMIVATGYFVAQEFAYMSVDRVKLRALDAEGDARATKALGITTRLSFMLSGAQLGITVTGLLIGFVAEPLVGESLGTLLGGIGIPRAVSIGVGTVLALVISTIATMVFGELFPKNYTIAAPMRSALWLARSTHIYLLLFGWLIRFFDWSANSLLRLVRMEPVHDLDSAATAEDLEYIVTTSRESGDLTDGQFLMLDRMLDFPDQDVEHAMVPRSKADFVHPDTTIGEVRRLMATQHTRYPIVDEDQGPLGVVHMTDLLGSGHADDAAVTQVMRDVVVVPERMPLPDAVAELRKHGEQLACVIDEYGGFAGLITVEDLAEEIFGDFSDEHDDIQPEEILPTDEDEWIVDGDAHLDELERAIGLDLPEGDYETVSGLLIASVGGLPAEGEVHDIELPVDPSEYADEDEPAARTLRLTVEAVERHVPSSVRIELLDEDLDGEER